MNNIGITLSKSDPAGRTMLEIFVEKGFKPTDIVNVFKMNKIYL